MDASQWRRALVELSGPALAGSMALVQAAPVSFTVALSGTQEVPPVQTKGSGSANLTFDPGTRVITDHHAQRPVQRAHHGAFPYRPRPARTPTWKV